MGRQLGGAAGRPAPRGPHPQPRVHTPARGPHRQPGSIPRPRVHTPSPGSTAARGPPSSPGSTPPARVHPPARGPLQPAVHPPARGPHPQPGVHHGYRGWSPDPPFPCLSDGTERGRQPRVGFVSRANRLVNTRPETPFRGGGAVGALWTRVDRTRPSAGEPSVRPGPGAFTEGRLGWRAGGQACPWSPRREMLVSSGGEAW